MAEEDTDLLALADQVANETFDNGITAGKLLMLNRMFALGRMLVDSGDATPYLTHFLKQIAEEEGFDVVRVDRHYEVVRRTVEPEPVHAGDEGGDPGPEAVHVVREADR